MNLEEYTQYHETKLHEQPGFAYNTYLCTIPLDFERVRLHWHEQMEIIYIKRGKGIVRINLERYPVHAGDIVPILPGELHAIEGFPDTRMEYENIIFSLSILDSTEENDWCRKNVLERLQNRKISFKRPIRRGSALHSHAAAALDGADNACRDKTEGYSLLVKSQLFLFFYALYQFQDSAGKPSAEGSSSHTERFKSLLTYIKEHFDSPISVQEAAAITGYSPPHFMRIFRQETGQTFTVFLNDYRLNAASYYLRETSDPISAVAALCGFDNLSYFIRCFRKRYGCSPGAYRKKLQ